MGRYYVVVCGRMTGIFDQWENGAKEQVERFSGSMFKSFSTLELAELWWSKNAPEGELPEYHIRQSSDIEDQVSDKRGSYITYAIIDPRNSQPFYVGQTSDLEQRKQAHLAQKNLHKQYKSIVMAIIALGLEPEFRVLDEQPTKSDSLRSETEWVKRFAAKGIRVMNKWREHQEWMDVLMPNHRN